MTTSNFLYRLLSKSPFNKGVSNIPGINRHAAVAVVLRVPHIEQCETLEDFFNVSLQDVQTEILFIQRQISEKDRWSGHVAFPGGHQEEGDGGSLVETARREAFEEVGLDLSEEHFLVLGTLSPRITRSKRKGRTQVTPIVFLQKTGEDYPLTLQTSEVASAWWINASLFEQIALGESNVDWVSQQTESYWRAAKKYKKITQWLGGEVLLVPGLLLPVDSEAFLFGMTFFVLSDLCKLSLDAELIPKRYFKIPGNIVLSEIGHFVLWWSVNEWKRDVFWQNNKKPFILAFSLALLTTLFIAYPLISRL